ncbi:hypothetical protein [Holophaga foetida]|uniref:hypothetical protein n=1 Tax=Holophaga foetida TaxID=35839 RepID=UPI0002471C51|nr:hypothetical protein [Holophaga foetida]
MPQLIQHIDDIARAKGRDVLFVRFTRLAELDAGLSEDDCLEREALIAFLDEQGISWEPCAPLSTSGWICGYFGDIYVDTPYDTEGSQYQVLQARLEFPDGTLRDPQVRFLLLPLASCPEPQARPTWEDL